jgi:hypothetical protein
MKVFDQLSEMKMTEEIENIMTEILPMFYSSVKLKYLPGNFESLVWIFRVVCMKPKIKMESPHMKRKYQDKN